MLRDDIKFHNNDFDVVADFDKKPDIERWLLDADLFYHHQHIDKSKICTTNR